MTDANLVLGRLNPEYCIGQPADFRLDVKRARQAIAQHIGEPLGLDPDAAAFAIVEVPNSKMGGQIRLISIERGHDPREFALIMYGGAGPLHANAVLKQLSLAKAVLPYYPGLTCAIGCIMADVLHDFERRWCETPIYDRTRLPPAVQLAGPAIVAQQDSTVVIEPGTRATVDAYGNLILE